MGETTARNMDNPAELTYYKGGLTCYLPDNGQTTVYLDSARITW